MINSSVRYVKDPIVGKYDWVYDLDLTSLYPSIIMTLNISPETKIGKIHDWDANEFMKGKVDTYSIGDDTITKDNLKEYLNDSKFSVSSNGVLYRTDEVGCIPGILDLWFQQRVEYKNEMKKYGKLVTKKNTHSFTKDNWFKRFYLTHYMVC